MSACAAAGLLCDGGRWEFVGICKKSWETNTRLLCVGGRELPKPESGSSMAETYRASSRTEPCIKMAVAINRQLIKSSWP